LLVAHGRRAVTVVVTAAVVERNGRFLVTRRPLGVHLAGFWEFPGGKCDAGETLERCLARELDEELAVDARVGPEMFTITHDYPDRSVELHFFRCEVVGEPRPRLGQEMRWVTRAEMKSLPFPPADEELIRTIVSGSAESR
jgi:mutator protein MutT